MRHTLSAVRPTLVMLSFCTAVLGLAYPLAVTGVAQAVLPAQANGSLIRDGGRVIGSELIGQSFASPRYFHGRPSAAGKGYDAMSSSGSNLGPASKALVDRVRADAEAARKAGIAGPFSADMLTASASGLDPHISPAAALAQVSRVAAARGLPKARVQALVSAAIEPSSLGLIGEPRVNVLLLNRQLDRIGASPAA